MIAGTPRPPRLSRRLLSWLLVSADRTYALSDLDEEFEARAERDGLRAARRWYRHQVWRSIRPAVARRWRGRLRQQGHAGRLGSLGGDVRHAARRLRSDLRLSVIVVAMLAFAIGSAVASFSILDSLVERQVPFPGGDRIHMLRGAYPPELIAAMRTHPAFDGIYTLVSDSQEVDTGPAPRRISAYRVTPALFDALDTAPQLGRLLRDDDSASGSVEPVLLSHALWRSDFASDPAIIGRTIRLSGLPRVVVGVMPEHFLYTGELWLPLDEAEPTESRSTHYQVRLAPGVTRNEGRELIRSLSDQMGLRPEGDRDFIAFGPLVYALRDDQRLGFRALGAGTLLIFLTVCTSVGSLLLAQVTLRRREFGTHLALGASPGRVFRQAVLERSLLAVAGVGLGLWLAAALLSAARRLLPLMWFPTMNPIDLDGRAMLVAAVLGATVVMVAGVLPALTAFRFAGAVAGRTASRTSSPGTRATRVLLVSQIALACTLLLGASVLVRSFVNMAAADRGFETRHLATAQFVIPPRANVDSADWPAYGRAALERILAEPGVRAATLSDIAIPGPAAPGAAAHTSDVPGAPTFDLRVRPYAVDTGFFELHQIPLLAGRTFEPGDTDTDVIVSSTLATRLWGDENPVGRTFSRRHVPHRVIGVAGEVTFPTIEQDRDGPEFYRQFTGMDFFSVTYRCDGPCPPADAIEAIERDLPPGLRMNEAITFDEVYGAALDQPLKAATFSLAFAAIGVLTAAAGLFSVLAYAVSRRRREFGIRAAIGASPEQLRAQVLGEGLRIALIGVTVGAAGAWAVGRAIAALQYGVTTADPISWAVVLTGIGSMTVAASWRPAVRAMRADPARLLRDE